uniref:Uncharacterized protein n=1 Tax=Anguilla anguilla TaxID=7936 RepID=A0A0E9USB1_ANGAN
MYCALRRGIQLQLESHGSEDISHAWNIYKYDSKHFSWLSWPSSDYLKGPFCTVLTSF